MEKDIEKVIEEIQIVTINILKSHGYLLGKVNIEEKEQYFPDGKKVITRGIFEGTQKTRFIAITTGYTNLPGSNDDFLRLRLEVCMRKLPSFNDVININKTIFLRKDHVYFGKDSLEYTIKQMLRDLLY